MKNSERITTSEDPRTRRRKHESSSSGLLKDFAFWKPILIACLIVSGFAAGVIFVPEILDRPITSESSEEVYASYKRIYDEVVSHNYAHGGDVEMERRIVKALNRDNEQSNLLAYFFDLMAASEYYYRTRDYERAVGYAEYAGNIAPSDNEWLMVTEFLLKAYKKTGNNDKLAPLQAEYDDFTAEPECAEDAAEKTDEE